MIPFDFIYCRPNTLKEAYQTYHQLRTERKHPVYYAGGSEIITMSRSGSIQPDAVIDIKAIPECNILETDDTFLHIGSVCTLNTIKESKTFPLLGLTCGRIADHTNQCRITLGGNLCGTIQYRETSLPLLLSDAKISIFGGEGLKTVPFETVFDGRMRLMNAECITQIHIPRPLTQVPYFHIKHTTNEKIDYPLVSMASLINDNAMRVAFSGVCSFPFRSIEMETVLNDASIPPEMRAKKAITMLPEAACSSVEGTGEYRLFVLETMMLSLLEGVKHGKI